MFSPSRADLGTWRGSLPPLGGTCSLSVEKNSPLHLGDTPDPIKGQPEWCPAVEWYLKREVEYFPQQNPAFHLPAHSVPEIEVTSLPINRGRQHKREVLPPHVLSCQGGDSLAPVWVELSPSKELKDATEVEWLLQTQL